MELRTLPDDLQNCQGFPLAAHTFLTGGADTGWATVGAGTAGDEIVGVMEEIGVEVEEAAAEAEAGGYALEDDDGGLALGQWGLGIGVEAEIVAVAHQKERGQMAQRVG